jgi:hypothetical protein
LETDAQKLENRLAELKRGHWTKFGADFWDDSKSPMRSFTAGRYLEVGLATAMGRVAAT